MNLLYSLPMLLLFVGTASAPGIRYLAPLPSSQDHKNEIPGIHKGRLLYANDFSGPDKMAGWIMEGPAITEFRSGWMHLYSPNEEGHHVFWCPMDFPGSFIAEWEVQNLEPDAGLCIVFFSAKGINGEDIFDPDLKERDGVFRKYTKSDLNTYHISYYANAEANGRLVSHLRKNKGFNKVQVGEPGIPLASTKIHKMKLIKNDERIVMFMDDRKIIDWTDDGETYGEVLAGGKIGLRQMKWTHFRYRNFEVWSIDDVNAQTPWPRHQIDASSKGADGIKMGDVNGDGRLDVVTGWEEGLITKLYLNPGAKGIRDNWPSVIVGSTPKVEDAVLADIDQDGRLDVVSCTEGKDRQIYVHFQPRRKILRQHKWKQKKFPAADQRMMWMYAEPLQIDGRNGVDLIAAGKGQGAQLGWLEAPAKGRGLNDWVWHPLTPVGWVMSIMPRDMDGDGDEDIVFTDRKGPEAACYWLENPGDPDLQKAKWKKQLIGTKGLEVMFMDMADLDGDGAEEVVVPERTGQTIRICRKTKQSWTEQILPLPEWTGSAKSVAVGDMNGDGVQDLVVSTNTNGEDLHGLIWWDGRQLKEEWPGNFQIVSEAHNAKYDQVVLYDLDEDGDLDILICEENFGAESEGLGVIWYENRLNEKR